MFYIKDIAPEDQTGTESYVKSLMDKDSIQWFPIEKCLKMEEGHNNRLK